MQLTVKGIDYAVSGETLEDMIVTPSRSMDILGVETLEKVTDTSGKFSLYLKDKNGKGSNEKRQAGFKF